MKTTLKVLLLILSISLISCEKKYKVKTPPEISTLEVTEITATSAVCGGEMEDYWKDLTLGILWSTEPWTVTETGSIVVTSETIGSSYPEMPGKRFTCQMTDLTPNTKYYVRALASCHYGLKCGEQIEFTTLAE